MMTLKKFKRKRLVWCIIAFIVALIGLHVIVNVAEEEKRCKKVYKVLCINGRGDTVAIYRTRNNLIHVDTLSNGTKKINYFYTVDRKHVSVATESGKIIIKEE